MTVTAISKTVNANMRPEVYADCIIAAGIRQREMMPRKRIYFNCSVEGCTNPHQAQGYCPKHYIAARRRGDIQIVQGVKNAKASS